MRVIILADTGNVEPFVLPRQLYEINGERVIDRIVRQVKDNKKRSIYITSHDERFDIEGTKRIEHANSWKGEENNGIWLDAFPRGYVTDSTVILFGDCWYTDEAIKTMVSYTGTDNHFFCTNIKQGKSPYYFKKHDEPLGWYIGNAQKFFEAVDELKEMQKTAEIPYCNWHLFRFMNGIDVNKHEYPECGYTAINDGSTDIDRVEDVEMITRLGKMFRMRCIKQYYDNCDKVERKIGAEWIVPYPRMLQLIGDNKARIVVAEIVEELKNADC